MRKLKYLFIVALLGFSLIVNAQGGKETTVGEFMRSDERAYVVIAIMLAILIGLILYLVRLDRKLSKWEKEK